MNTNLRPIIQKTETARLPSKHRKTLIVLTGRGGLRAWHGGKLVPFASWPDAKRFAEQEGYAGLIPRWKP